MSIKNKLASLACFIVFALSKNSHAQSQQYYYELRIYHYNHNQQDELLDDYFKNAYKPAMNKLGFKIGAFRPIGNDTASNKKLYIFIPFKSLNEWEKTEQQLQKNNNYVTAARGYTNSLHNNPPYTRFETIFMRGFKDMPSYAIPPLKSSKDERIYELRSYESATDKLFKNKVDMFNRGGEIALFHKLNFNAVFYGEVIFGAQMPNLIYMTSFENKKERDEHWKTFGNDPEWKKLSALPEYQNNVSHIDIVFLRSLSYSDF
ncbi:MAG: NIPSNAP family protein [Chitinophagaceae bacterium]